MLSKMPHKPSFEMLYYASTRFLDTSLLGLLVGLSSGIAINVSTSENLRGYFFGSIVLNIIAVVCLVVLIRIRQKIEQALAKRLDYQTPALEKWRQSADWKNKFRVGCFFGFLVGLIICFFTGIAFIIVANSNLKKEEDAQAKEKKQIEKQEFEEINTIKEDITVVYDSIQHLSRDQKEVRKTSPSR